MSKKDTIPTNIPDEVRNALLALPEEDLELLTAGLDEDGKLIGLGFMMNGKFAQWADPWKQPYLDIIAAHYKKELEEIHSHF